MNFSVALARHWRRKSPVSVLLIPLAGLYGAIIFLRRWAYRLGICSIYRSRVPVVIVGNLTVGGTGKTPVVIALTHALRQRGWRPGIVSRGYKGRASRAQRVSVDSKPDEVGDESILLAQKSGVPVAVCPRRVEAVKLLEATEVDVILSDDGLQHLALARAAEIALWGGFGNGLLIPAGPMRETRGRLQSVDLVLGPEEAPTLHTFTSTLGNAINLVSGERLTLEAFAGETVVAIAGIARPERFFEALKDRSIEVSEKVFPDHHRFIAQDIPPAATVLMTEKDAVKCRPFAQPNWWAVELQCELPDEFIDRLEELLRQKDGR